MKIKIILGKIKGIVTTYLQRLSDIKFAGQLLFVVIVLLISWSGVKAIQTNYQLQKQISSLQQQNDLEKLQTDNLSLENQYLNSNQYLELSARQNLGLANPGEKEIMIPESVAKSYETALPTDGLTQVSIAKQPTYQLNFQSWVDFFFHRTSNQ